MPRRSTSYSAILFACALTMLVGCPAHGPTEDQPDGSSEEDQRDDTGGQRDTEGSSDDTQAPRDARDATDGESVENPDGRADGGSGDTGDVASDTGADTADAQSRDAGDAGDDTAADTAMDSTSPPQDSAETGTETGMDADGGGPVVQPAQGDVVVTEMMASPDAIADSKGEYFEVYNTSSSEAFDLEGCTILDTDQDSHKLSTSNLTGGSSLVLQPGARLTLAKSTMPGFSPDYTFPSDWYLSGDDEVILECNSTTVDEVDYSGWSVGPNGGAALGLDPTAPQTAAANDQASNWCDQSTSLPNTSDKGTPGQPNDSCS